MKLPGGQVGLQDAPFLCIARLSQPRVVQKRPRGSGRRGAGRPKVISRGLKPQATTTVPVVALAAPLSLEALRLSVGHLLTEEFDVVWNKKERRASIFRKLSFGEVCRLFV